MSLAPSPLLAERFSEALTLTVELHSNQSRKRTPTPYLGHLLGVASIVIDSGGDEDEVIAALLHDAVEDQGGKETLELIRERFGDRVAGIVWACSDTDEVPKPPWRKRKEDYLAHLESADASTLLVSCADKLHNARSIVLDHGDVGSAVWDRFSASREQTLWYYGSLAEVFERRLPDSQLSRELSGVVERLESLD